ncbi:GntR family transcriptional regulator [Aquibacillus albus]|uniref:GntR family transcriptional regulator of arabinose operon n=1 Tax=Aquibacillus albus TaxID=1168171 RepID=A0ABS2MXW5_9BACI|nr:GntR family transcriptional regulator [Aquibacillus albus]MBM7570689.1 GntR family transcriptional regulator of arabinose operon [Aquibacillus albus]
MQTKYNIVKQAIKSKILDGTFQPHQKISSESELMKQFDVSRHTVRLAIGDLVNQGWLYREQGAGTFCADRSQVEAATNGNQKNIAIITTYISDYIFPSIIRGAESYLSEQGYHVSLFSTNNDHENEKRFLETILTQNFDGVIIEPTKSALTNPNINYYLNLERQHIPYIMINAYYDELEPINIVLDDEKGAYLQTEHLIKLGHRNIVGFFKTDDIQGTKRMKGYLKAHRTYGLPINPNNIVTYSSNEKETKPNQELRNFLSRTVDKPTGVVCYNDELAIKLLDVLRELKLKVPEDISVVGFDDSFLAKVSEVKLTTVAHPKSEMGKNAAKVILDLVKEKETNKKKANSSVESIVYDPQLIVRHSTKELES